MGVLKIGLATDCVIVKRCQFLANLAPLETPKLSREVTSRIDRLIPLNGGHFRTCHASFFGARPVRLYDREERMIFS